MRVGIRPDNPLEAVGLLAGRFGLKAGQIPNALFEAYFAPMMARTIMAGAKLGIYDELAKGAASSGGIAERLGLDSEGVDVLCVALHSMGYLGRDKSGRWSNGEQVSRHLVEGAPAPLTDTLKLFCYDMWELIEHLEEAVSTGEPAGWLHTKPADDPWWESYMRGLFELSQLRAPQVVGMIKADSPRTLVDVAGGHGGFSMAMCRKHPGLRATVVELEGAAKIGEAIAAEQGMSDRVGWKVTDMFEGDLGSGYDVGMANSILHHFSAEDGARLLGRIREALAPGGTLAIVEQERPAEGRRGDQLGALTGVLFYTSSKVRTYTSAELVEIAERAGFESVQANRSPLVPGIVVVTGRKEG